jgi:hypothetical protein
MSDSVSAYGAICCGIIIFIATLSLPICQLVYSSVYKDEMACDTSMQIHPYEWMITEGSITLFEIVTMFFVLITSRSALPFTGPLVVTLIMTGVFQMGWLIYGSVLFWRDCLHLQPNSVNHLFWATLIMGILGIVGTCCSGKATKSKQNN